MVLPCFNPPIGWEKVVVSSIKNLEEKGGVSIDLILVNDGSTQHVMDEHITLIKDQHAAFKYIQYTENRGKGYALRQGVAAANNDLIIYTDIDFPYTADSFLTVFEKLKKGNDVVPGHRGKAYYENTPLMRKLISKFLRWTLKTFLRLPTDDSQCGIKGFNQVGAKVFLDTQIDRFLFDLEFIKPSAKRKVKMEKAPVELKPNVVFNSVSLKILARESLNFVRILFRK